VRFARGCGTPQLTGEAATAPKMIMRKPLIFALFVLFACGDLSAQVIRSLSWGQAQEQADEGGLTLRRV
jgi:hypothetical protein